MATHKMNGFNTIAVLTYHIGYYVKALRTVLNGQALEANDKFSFDLPPIRIQAEWEAMVGTLLEDAEALATQIADLPDGRLAEVFVDPKYGTWFRNIHGLIEHTHYHLGQIAILKKACTSAQRQSMNTIHLLA